ncbi:hypothetical protein [Blastococcus saxobsidens]|uniref:Uncharacterized protein n=1 Tax=Blastococcus saxobsidens (strain DD2) TaxID=1146883 RepID=H6RVR0_BLASD|nr:hypothetical protein [Blastococcus saxobsidens]CCG04540.1 conserved protein of unknown function [Blastococcus saxobsidens DD2]
MARLFVTMETMHAVGRRNLPPVPRAAAETIRSATVGTITAAETTSPAETVAAVTTISAPADPEVAARFDAPAPAEAETEAAIEPVVPGGPDATAGIDAGQAFVARLRAAGATFAEAAGAESALVREVVPPARHRRSRCRVVFRYADGTQADLTFVGERRRPGTSSQDGLGEEITRWLASGQLRDPAWLVPDPEAPDGLAVDVTAWLATG